MSGLDFLREKHTVWDNVVPIVAHDNGDLEVYLTDSIDEPLAYNELCHRLRLAPASSTVTLHINTPGGIIDSALMIIDAIRASKARVIGYLTGTVASAGTIIALACENIIVGDHTTFMIHNYSASGIHGKGHEIKAYQTFVDANLEAAFRSFYSGFLSTKEMTSVIDGQDLWLNKDEVMRRWAIKTSGVTTTTPRRGRPAKVS